MHNIKKLNHQLRYLVAAGQNGDRIEYDIYIDHYFEWLKFMKHLGPYISMAFKDKHGKAMHMLRNRKLMESKFKFIDKGSKEYTYLMDFIKLEYELGIQAMNEDNVSDEFKQAVKKKKGRNIQEWMKDDFDKY